MEVALSSKLLGLVGSPRKSANTDLVVEEALDAFRNMGGETEKIFLSSPDINPCTGCRSCSHKVGLESVCIQEEDMTELYQKMLAADALLWATPIYMWSPTSQMKLYLDRLFPLGDYQTTRWKGALNGKSAGLIVVHAHKSLSIVKKENAKLLTENNTLKADIGYWKCCHERVLEREAGLTKELEVLRTCIQGTIISLFLVSALRHGGLLRGTGALGGRMINEKKTCTWS